jgi:copper oxidase (laccase) domain-containing protein
MKNKFKCLPADIKAGIGPAIGKCCFSVNREVAEKFIGHLERSEYFVNQNNSSSYIDLKEANKIQMILAGLKEQNIETSEICTSCSSDVFFSHRSEKGRTGRFALLAGLHSS